MCGIIYNMKTQKGGANMLHEILPKITELQKLYSKNKTNTTIKREIAKQLFSILSALINTEELSRTQKRQILRCNIILTMDLSDNSNKIRLREVFTNLQEILSN